MQLYLISDNRPTQKLIDLIHPLLDEGLCWIQLRNKTASLDEIEITATKLLPLIQEYDANLIINDHLSIAHSLQLGLHMGLDDGEPTKARNTLGHNATLGITIHNDIKRAETYQDIASYVGVGPIFPTQTKKDAKRVIGIPSLKKIISSTSLPVVAIGGISKSNIHLVARERPQMIAICSAICSVEHPVQTYREMMRIIQSHV